MRVGVHIQAHPGLVLGGLSDLPPQPRSLPTPAKSEFAFLCLLCLDRC